MSVLSRLSWSPLLAQTGIATDLRVVIPARILAVLLGIAAAFLAAGGVWLISLGGSWYYGLIGLAYLAAAVQLWRLRQSGVWLIVLLAALTLAWALIEVGFHFWPLFPRLLAPAALSGLSLLLAPFLAPGSARPLRFGAFAGAAISLALAAGLFGFAFRKHEVITPADGGASFRTTPAAARPGDWSHYGREPNGGRFAPIDQITRDNVGSLKVAWTFRTGDLGRGEEQNVPLQVGDTLYTCTRNNRIAALDADTGAVKWRFDPQAHSPVWQRCRGLGYHDADAAVAGGVQRAVFSPRLPDAPLAPCRRRIIQTTIDARLIALDAATGAPCAGFGRNGQVDLSLGMGPVKPGFYFQTSAPTVVRNLVIIGGWVRDNQERGEPSGVVRAFDVTTGALVWAWDLGNPAVTREPPAGGTYTRGTPNMWSTPSFDAKLGLLYVPLGNATPDYYGAGRSALSEKYASSVVALDIATGRERWHFQTVHHDLWDYDVGSQPALIDVPDGKGGITPALLQTTKRGQLFLLNRATGASLTPIEERPVPRTGQAPGEWLSPTQPYPVGIPSVGTERLTERRMWGMTLFDQMLCRIAYRRHDYQGDFTPPSLRGSIEQPGNYGGFNWGSVAVDPTNTYAFMTDIRMPVTVRLMPLAEIQKIIARTKGVGNRHGPARQLGTPYGVVVLPMLSALGVPCVQPPFGTMTALNVRTRQIAWQTPIGTPQDTGPLGIRTGLQMPVGMPTISGPMATGSGLVFFAGTQDFYLRAMDAATGREVWRSRLPVGSSSTPMTYVSPRTGRQYVVISAGGASGSPVRGDHVIAYALPGTSR